jgi:hypothetical protein
MGWTCSTDAETMYIEFWYGNLSENGYLKHREKKREEQQADLKELVC